ncbi:hypothetical protein [Microbacterium sp. CH12i]
MTDLLDAARALDAADTLRTHLGAFVDAPASTPILMAIRSAVR